MSTSRRGRGSKRNKGKAIDMSQANDLMRSLTIMEEEEEMQQGPQVRTIGIPKFYCEVGGSFPTSLATQHNMGFSRIVSDQNVDGQACDGDLNPYQQIVNVQQINGTQSHSLIVEPITEFLSIWLDENRVRKRTEKVFGGFYATDMVREIIKGILISYEKTIIRKNKKHKYLHHPANYVLKFSTYCHSNPTPFTPVNNNAYHEYCDNVDVDIVDNWCEEPSRSGGNKSMVRLIFDYILENQDSILVNWHEWLDFRAALESNQLDVAVHHPVLMHWTSRIGLYEILHSQWNSGRKDRRILIRKVVLDMPMFDSHWVNRIAMEAPLMSVLRHHQNQLGHDDDFFEYDADPACYGLLFLKLVRHSSKHIMTKDRAGNYEHLTQPGHEAYLERRYIDTIWSKLFPEALPQLCRALISRGFQYWKIGF